MVLLTLMITVVIEALLHAFSARFRTVRKILAVISAAACLGAGVLIIFKESNIFGLIVAVLYGYRCFNMARIVEGRMHQQYLRHVTYRTSCLLILAQMMIIVFWSIWLQWTLPSQSILLVLLVIQLGVSLIFLLTARGHGRRMHRTTTAESYLDADLPSITVAIPARNETDDLYDCIHSLLASHYPKLEILVLDDCSQTRRTPEIIRDFAHDGVRFIQGQQPTDTWLAKNLAYETLAAAASGAYVIFAGVDVRFQPDSLRQLVTYALARKKDMLCVMPRNVIPLATVPLIQPMRYVWELVLPRKLVNKPPVLSSCWLISKEALHAAGGFRAASRMVVPEAYLARHTALHNGYSFVSGMDVFGISSVKNPQQQRDTAIRVAYPQTHRRPEVVALLTLCYFAWISVPATALGVSHGLSHYGVLAVLSSVVIGLNLVTYRMVCQLAYGKSPAVLVASLPLAALVYVGLLNYSMYKYEFSEVLWKGRNVCLPVMHVIPHLPNI